MVRWKWLLILVVLIPFGAIAGCIDDPAEEGSLRFTDPLGDEVVLDDHPERIVTLSPALTETVFALGIGSKVVATDNVSNYPAEAASLPKVFSYSCLASEQLVMADPDLVIMDKTLDISEKAYNTIKGLGIPVYRIYPRNVGDVLDAITGIGEVTNTEAEAKVMIDDFVDRMVDITLFTEDIPPDDRPGVLLVTYYDGDFDPWVSTDSTMSGGLIEAAGGRNMISDDTGIVVTVSVETAVGADPDIIICTQSNVWPTQTKSKILSDERWKDISAVKQNRVYEIDGDLVDRTGPRLILGLEGIHSHVREYLEE